MNEEPRKLQGTPSIEEGTLRPQAISLDEAGDIAEEVQDRPKRR